MRDGAHGRISYVEVEEEMRAPKVEYVFFADVGKDNERQSWFGPDKHSLESMRKFVKREGGRNITSIKERMKQ